MTRLDEIRNMSVDEMAEFIDDLIGENIHCNWCAYAKGKEECQKKLCITGVEKWLKSEVHDNE